MKQTSLALLLLILLSVCFGELAFCSRPLRGEHEFPEADENCLHSDDLARFDVEDALLEFARVVKATEEVVAGTMHRLTIEAMDAGKKKLYEATIWVKPWLNFKELQGFKHAGDVPSFTSSDLGPKRGGHGPGWQEVPVHDPAVQDAANHAVEAIQQRSDCLCPYELLEVVHAKAEVVDNLAKFEMLLKVKINEIKEKYRATVHKNREGALHLNQLSFESRS